MEGSDEPTEDNNDAPTHVDLSTMTVKDVALLAKATRQNIGNLDYMVVYFLFVCYSFS